MKADDHINLQFKSAKKRKYVFKKQNKTNDQEKRKNRFLRRESKPRPLAFTGYALSIALRHLTINIGVRLNINVYLTFFAHEILLVDAV